jgi:hypothetical protein
MSDNDKRSAVADIFHVIKQIVLMPLYIVAAIVAIIASTISS